jgi:threonine dehydratase
MTARFPTIKDIEQASQRIGSFIHRTPVLTCRALDRLSGARLFFKCENFQKAGVFKTRGAANAVFSLGQDEAARGVATHSSGNHAAALALAARSRGIKAYVVMPKNSRRVKLEAVDSYGAEIVLCEPTLEARENTLAGIVKQTGAVFVHPYNDFLVIAGQGTAAMELCEDIPDLEAVLTPVGGGGLLSGTSIAVSALSPGTDVWAAEPEQADDAYRSFYSGKFVPSENPDTIADGLLTSLGDLTFPIIKKHVKGIVTVSEDEIKWAMRTVWERMKVIVEPSTVVPVAALLSGRVQMDGKRIGVILSGGNVDLENLPWIQ